jgi:hypothetical protein
MYLGVRSQLTTALEGEATMKYKVYGTVTGTKYLGTFEAESAEVAETMALNSDVAYVNLCHQCFGECEDAVVTEVSAEEA